MNGIKTWEVRLAEQFSRTAPHDGGERAAMLDEIAELRAAATNWHAHWRSRGKRIAELEAALSRRPAAEPSDDEIYQAVSERHATPELRAAVEESLVEVASAVAAEQPAAEPDWKNIAYELAQRVNMAITHGKFGASGMMLDTETHATRSVKDWMADAMEIMPGVTVRRDLMHMTAAQRRKAMKAGAQVAWYTDDHLADKSATTWDSTVAQRWRAKGWPVGELFATPPAQDAGTGELLAALVEAEAALAGGLWDFGPGQDEHERCNEVIERCRRAIANSGRKE